jgi:tetratricopeptide (TPR) repeat protein
MSRLASYAGYARLSTGVLNGDSQARTSELLRLGINAYQEGALDLAERSLRRAARLSPDRADLQAALGAVVYDRGRLAEASTIFSAALSLNPEEEDALLGMAATLQVMGSPGDAIYYYLSYLRLEPDSVVALTNLGAAFESTGQVEEAIEMFERACQLEPDNPDVFGSYGRSLYEVGRFDDAIDQLHQAVELESTDGEVYHVLGLALAAKDDLPAARGLLERAVELDSGNVAAQIDLSDLLLSSNEPRKALEHALRAVEAADAAGGPERERANAYWQLGWAHYKLGEWQESTQASRKALEIDPEVLAVRFNLGLALLRAGEVEEARSEYQRALEAANDAWDLKSLGIIDLTTALSEDREASVSGGREILDLLEAKYRELSGERTASKAHG